MTKAVAAKSWDLEAIGGRRYSHGNSALAIACAALSPGQCVKFANLPESVLEFGSENADFLKYASSGCYDPLRRQVRFVGRRESVDFPYHGLMYDEATDTWSNDDWVLWTTDTYGNGHAYDHNAVDPATGDQYFRPYNTQEVWHYDGSWTQLPTPGTIGAAGSLEYIPLLGLVYTDRRRQKLLRPGAGSWEDIFDTGSSTGEIHAVSQYNPNSRLFLYGAGNLDDTLQKVLVTNGVMGSPAAVATPSIPLGAGEDQGCFTHDPGSDDFVGWQKKTANWAAYSAANDQWDALTQSDGDGSTPDTGTPNISNAAGGHPTIFVPISRYRTIMVVQSTGSGGSAWLYKHLPVS